MNPSKQQNPEHTLPPISFNHSKNLLKTNQIKKESNAKFFQDTKIRSCSYVKPLGGEYVAVPFYQKRYEQIYPTNSTHVTSWNSHIHAKRQIEHAGSNTKRLQPYDPEGLRSRILVEDHIPSYRNTSVIEIGERSAKDPKHWVTTKMNYHNGKQVSYASQHPGINAFRNKWERHLIEK